MVQIGTTNFPIIVKPRINGVLVTQTEIKNDYSNSFVDDATTPLTFTLEYREVNQVGVNAVVFDSVVSQDDFVFFSVPNSLYESKKEWTIAVFWTIGTEKWYCIKPYHLSVDDVHNQ